MKDIEKYWRCKFDQLALLDIPDWQRSFWWNPGSVSSQQRYITGVMRKLPANRLIADIGCGPGTACRQLIGDGHRVVGIDFSKNALRLAHYRRKDNLEFYCQGDANELPLKNCIFDIVLAMGILQSAEDPIRHLKQIFDILKPGGLLIFSTLAKQKIFELPFYPAYCLINCDHFPDHDNFQVNSVKTRNIIFRRPEDKEKYILKRYATSDLKNWLKITGFEGIKLSYNGKLTQIPYLLNSFIVFGQAVRRK